MFLQRIILGLKWLGEQIDTVLALSLAAVCSILGLFGASQALLLTATLGVLTILAFTMLRDRAQREHLRSSLNQLTATFDSPSLDNFFKISADDTQITVDAEREIWFVQETGTYSIATQRAAIKALLQRGGNVRFVIVKPEVAELTNLAFRNGYFSSATIKGRTSLFKENIQGLIDDFGEYTENLQVRFTPYILDNAFIFVDPNSPVLNKRKGVFLHLGFHVSFEDRLGTMIQGDTSPKLFSYYTEQVRQIFKYSTKIVLVSGSPRSGKTMLMKKLIDNMDNDNRSHLFSILTQSVWNGNQHIGYEIKTSTNPKPCSFAIRQNDGSFDVNDDVWTSIINDLEHAYSQGKIIVLDEIGTLHLMNTKFLDIIEKIIHDPSATMFATLPSDDKANGFLRKIKLHYRSTVLTLRSEANVGIEIEKYLKEELEASLYLADLTL